ncbi:MAG: DMT family transporter [Candidatus Nitrohelix vancouverensis]|uniref:DMT family transporter n=1 Tax=Candidatus Nitrohelix vancouverensis TaxID=2705534 RepID=A0A7T0G4H4_9BACT|nr:MAG: DMT family transporter [Candidatus Nitrohelix vancouverensis]
MGYFYLGLALLGGIAIPIQVGINASLAKQLDSSTMAAFISFAVGAIGLLIYNLTTRQSLPAFDTAARLPVWMWAGGLLGAFVVWVAIASGHKIGALSLMGAFLAGQLFATLVIDHYGLLGFPERPLNWERMLGTGFLILGVALIRKF